MNKLYRIKMDSLQCESVPVPSEYERLGGRGFCSTLITKEVNPTCSPLGPDNKLVIAPGILAGTLSPCSQRVSVGGKSPLTGGIKEANAGGTSGQKMGRLGVAAIVLEGKPEAGRFYTLHEVGKGTVLGRVIGNGAVTTGKVFGVERVPAIKGQRLPAWDPRTALATGVTFITSPQGADHTAGRLQGVMEFDRLKPGTIAQLSKEMQIRACFYDTVGFCHFADGTPESAEWLAKLLSAFHGERLSVDYVMETGQKILETELHFNRAAGITEADDRLPEFMLKEPLPPTHGTFSVPREEIEEAFAGLKNRQAQGSRYKARG